MCATNGSGPGQMPGYCHSNCSPCQALHGGINCSAWSLHYYAFPTPHSYNNVATTDTALCLTAKRELHVELDGRFNMSAEALARVQEAVEAHDSLVTCDLIPTSGEGSEE